MMRWLIHQKFACAAVLAVMSGLCIAGCKSLNQIAPPVDERLTLAGGGADRAVLERGRAIYLNQCASCHVAEPVHDYNARQWAEILPPMNREAKLKPAQAADLKAYIDACLAAGPGEF